MTTKLAKKNKKSTNAKKNPSMSKWKEENLNTLKQSPLPLPTPSKRKTSITAWNSRISQLEKNLDKASLDRSMWLSIGKLALLVL